MKLNYNVLWFEDRPDDISQSVDGIRMFVEKQGFNLNIDSRETISEDEIRTLADELRTYNNYDLIVCDHDLGSGIDGAQIAATLRRHVFTDLVFYSGKTLSNLRKILYEGSVDAAFPIHRTELREGLRKIIGDHIRRSCDLNNMRGIVIDEICKVERVMRKALMSLVEDLDEGQKSKVLDKIKEKIREKGQKAIDSVVSLECPVKALGDHRMSDFNVVRMRLGSLKKQSEIYDLLKEGGELKDVQDLRNRMAHVEASFDSDKGAMVFADRKGETLTYDEFQKIRLRLREISLKISEELGVEPYSH